jgi:hypothetical protein
VGVDSVISGKPIVNLPGCPPNPYNLLAVVLEYVTMGKLPELDQYGRPRFAYERVIHENCPRRAHFDAGRFAMAFGDEGRSYAGPHSRDRSSIQDRGERCQGETVHEDRRERDTIAAHLKKCGRGAVFCNSHAHQAP